ncbi:MFS transporter [Brevibacillus humidisoli]|uniref:MFS transporter n=1 Tax=Brevibacillus humidisoli TaxID=2895522 RepID=UPI001E613437|nr:MFS transporter [Brevibacillus humidisoli]UFJ39473.1 MFS transporter [Brevibacillus humidisoli]
MIPIYALRAYNYFYFSLLAIFISFLPVYLNGRGISPAEIGLLVGVGAFVGIISQPIWGVISDKYRTIRKVVIVVLAVSLVLGTLLFQFSNILLLLVFVLLLYFFLLPSDPLTESLSYQVAQQHQISFGSIRMFGAIGYATASLFIGYVLDWFGIGSMAVLFFGYALITLLLAFAIPDAPAAGKPVSLASLQQFLFYPKTLWFFLLVLIAAIPHRTNDVFLGVYIQSMDGTTGMVGQAWFLASMSEVAFFAGSAWWLRKGKERQLIQVAAVVYVLRYLACSLVTDPQWVVYLQLLHGLTFAVFYLASIQYLYQIVPEEWRATGQTALAVIFFGISGIIGSFAGGWVFDRFGGSTLYLVMSIGSLLSLLFSTTVPKNR